MYRLVYKGNAPLCICWIITCKIINLLILIHMPLTLSSHTGNPSKHKVPIFIIWGPGHICHSFNLTTDMCQAYLLLDPRKCLVTSSSTFSASKESIWSNSSTMDHHVVCQCLLIHLIYIIFTLTYIKSLMLWCWGHIWVRLMSVLNH